MIRGTINRMKSHVGTIKITLVHSTINTLQNVESWGGSLGHSNSCVSAQLLLGLAAAFRHLLHGRVLQLFRLVVVGRNLTTKNFFKRLVATCHSFWFIVFVLYMIQEYCRRNTVHYCCMDVVGWKRHEVGFKLACRVNVVGVCGFWGSNAPVSECPPA